MSDNVVFDEEHASETTARYTEYSNKGVLEWLVSNKIARNTKQAEYILLCICVFFVVIAIVIFTKEIPTKPIVKDFSKTDFIHPTQSP